MSKLFWKLDQVTLQGVDRHRLDALSCSIGIGVTAILGSSGAGKSSLLAVLAGMERPDAGSIEHLRKRPAGGLPIYWAPQGGGLWPHMSVRRHLSVLCKDTGESDKLLSKFDLTERAAAIPGELSQGERARLSIARALAVPASVLLFDEPLIHVDGFRKATGWSTIRAHLTATGTSLVLATHEPDVVLREADNILCLAAGRLVYQGSVQDLYRNPPDEASGQFLGPLNWFTPEDRVRWLPVTRLADTPLCLRPEQLRLDVVSCSAENRDQLLEVLDSVFVGSYAETTVRNPATSELRRLIHRPAGALTRSQNVRLEINRDGVSGDKR